ncbi:hypothetical protein M5689_024132 [Euphorbia peplus]|nr:hypothetical protein M5689_024132 [Euphorbia peplus]
MGKTEFMKIHDALEAHSPYFTQRQDATGRLGLSPKQKISSALRMLAYGEAADRSDEYLRIAESTALECLSLFCRSVIEVFGSVYLRKPTANDVRRLFAMHETIHGFPGMLGSLDCMHWEWKNCPTAWQGQYTRGDQGVPTIMLEAVASHDLWIWHAFFGMAGTNNDINVLNRSHLFREKVRGQAPEEVYTLNNKIYNMGYYLVDGIYPEWAAFVKSFSNPIEPKKRLFKTKHEGARKDVERAFGVLQSRFNIIRGPVRFWDQDKLHDIMDTCIILHNMIVEAERGGYQRDYPQEEPSVPDDFAALPGPPNTVQDRIEADLRIRNRVNHHILRDDLVEHVWNIAGPPDLNNPGNAPYG